MATLMLLSAGAAKGLVTSLAADFRVVAGATIDAHFDAVGAIRERLEAGALCDVIILTAALIEALERGSAVVAGSIVGIGRVDTGVATRTGDAVPDIRDASALRRAFVAAPAVFVPDMTRSTAGRHFSDLLQRLGVAADVAPRVREFPNGAAAMRALAEAALSGALGCTQVTEILYTPGVALAGALPPECALETVYAGAISASAHRPELARRFLALLTDPATRDARRNAGFEAVQPTR
jgi:molybdate transport system substrate-binding protein